jgi:hypothetical protein
MADFISPEIKATDQYKCAMGDKDACARLISKAAGQYGAQALLMYDCAAKQNKEACVKAALLAAGGSSVEQVLLAYDCASKADKDACIRAAIKSLGGASAEQILQVYDCASNADKDACIKAVIRGAGGAYVEQELQAYECAKNGDADECKKLVLTMAAQEACVATGPAAVVCVYIAPFLVRTIYPYLKGFVNGILGAPGVFLSDIGIDLSGLMAQGVFSPSSQAGDLAVAVVAQWKQAVAGVEAVWHAARLEAGLPPAPVAINSKIVAESVAKKNNFFGLEDVVGSVTEPTPITWSKLGGTRPKSLSARQALLSWLYAYSEGWNKREVRYIDASYVNGQAVVWTVPQEITAFKGEPEDAVMIRGPLAIGPNEAYDGDRGGWPEKCNKDCLCGWCWQSRLDALALGMIAMTQVISQQVVEEAQVIEERGRPTVLGNTVRVGTGVAVASAAGYGAFRGLLWLLPKLFGSP